MDLKNESDGWTHIGGPISNTKLLQHSISVDCERLSFSSLDFLSGEIAKSLSNLKNLRELYIYCDVGRTAIRHLLKLPNLEKIDLLCLRSPGRKISGFENARNLKELHCNHCLIPSDLCAIAKSKSIEELWAQASNVDKNSIEAILQMPSLKKLDLESTKLDDEMVSGIAVSTTIKLLCVGSTNLTETGFREICQMKQLESLDAWSINISESSLDQLENLTKLEYLSIGGLENQEVLTAAGVISRLDNIPSLKWVWLDGIAVSEAQAEYLNDKYDSVSLT